MNTWEIGLSTGCFYRRRIFDVLDAIRESGFKAIEVCSFPLHLDYHKRDDVIAAGNQLRSLGLRPASFHAPFSEGIDITALDVEARRRATDELVVACEAASAMGVEYVVLHPGPERSGRPEQGEFLARMDYARESLDFVAHRCCEIGVELVLENMLPHLLFGHSNDMLYLLNGIRTCDVGACLDTGHAFLARELDSVVQKLSSHLKLVHVNDNRGERDEHLAPGDGHIDWQQVLRDLKRSHFAGTLILELSASELESIPDIMARANRSREFLLKIMQNLD